MDTQIDGILTISLAVVVWIIWCALAVAWCRNPPIPVIMELPYVNPYDSVNFSNLKEQIVYPQSTVEYTV